MTAADLAPWRARCPACGAPVLWAETSTGKPLPVNPAPAPERGNVALAVHGGQLVAGVLRRNQAAGARDHGRPLYTAHAPDCVPPRHGRTRR